MKHIGVSTRHQVPLQDWFWDQSTGTKRVFKLNKTKGKYEVLGVAPSLPIHDLVVKPNGQPAKQRSYHVLSRMGDNHELGVFNNSVYTVERALMERYFLCKVGNNFMPALKTPKRYWGCAELLEFRQSCVEYARQYATVLTLQQVVECYTGAKRRVYENALRSIQRKNIHRKDSHLRPFPKFEKQKLTAAPRIINPRSPRYNLVLGKYLKKGEKIYYRAINEAWGCHTDHTVIKGLNSQEVARVMRQKWDRFSNTVAIGLDATKFDMHVSVNALMYEHGFYNGVFKSKELASLLRWQLINRGKAYCPDGTVLFKMPGTRASGDINTSLGNCIIMCSLIWALCKGLGINAELANNGDDCVIFMESADLSTFMSRVSGFFTQFGFRMTIETPVYEFEEVEFCQSNPVKLGTGWHMVRNVRTCLRKDPMCLIPIQNDRVWRKWLGAVGECGIATVPGCPILQEFYQCFVRNGCGSSAAFKQHIFKNTGTIERMGTGKYSAVTDESRASFYKAFGITPDYQIAVEDYFSKVVIGSVDNCQYRIGEVENSPPCFLRHL